MIYGVTAVPEAAPTTPTTTWTSASRPQNPYYMQVSTRDVRVPVRHFGYAYPARPMVRRYSYPYLYPPGRIIPIYTRFGLTYLLKWSLNICGGVYMVFIHRTVSQNAHLKAARQLCLRSPLVECWTAKREVLGSNRFCNLCFTHFF